MSDSGQAEQQQSISFAEAFRYWLKLGFISFGGPAGQIAIMHQELVEKRRWISEKRFMHALNYCMLLPGPEAQQLATYIGWLMHRTWGGIVAGGLFVLPSLLILIALSWIYMAFGQVPAVAGILYGIKPAVTAIVLFAAWRIGSRTLRNAWLWSIAVAAFIAIFALNLPFPLIVLAAGVIGYVGGRVAPDKFKAGGGHGATGKSFGPAIIDDDTPTPRHALFSWPHTLKVIAVFALLWIAAMAGLVMAYGWDSTLTLIGWFFTKAALLTFGGAYAVLPYVYQASVQTYQWLTPEQMIDGLALGETTPGPLIMIVAYVGFVAAWAKAVFGTGAAALALAGAMGATVATFFTFLPSFLFILSGGPFIESTHGNLKFTAPLTGITAAVVGVIVNLAVFFAWHVFFPDAKGSGLTDLGRFDAFSALVALAAFIAQLRYQVNVIKIIGACGLAGLLARLLM